LGPEKGASGEQRMRPKHISPSQSRKSGETLSRIIPLGNSARVLKHDMQRVTDTLQVSIGFLFKKQQASEKGLSALLATDAPLAKYLSETRKWSEPLIEQRILHMMLFVA
jgi:hypothetical protein